LVPGLIRSRNRRQTSLEEEKPYHGFRWAVGESRFADQLRPPDQVQTEVATLSKEIWVMGRVFGVLFVLSLVACGKVIGQSEAPGWDPISPPGPGSFVLAVALYQPGATALQRSPLTVPTRGAHVASPLSSGTSPVAIPTPDGSGLLFSTWKYYGGPPTPGTEPTTGVRVAHPAIWLLNLETGVQSLVADGAVSLALSMSGQVAYVKGDRPDYFANEPFAGTIEMRSVEDRSMIQVLVPEVDNYRVVAWAGDSLLYYKLRDGGSLDLYRVREGEAPRLLAEETGVVAVSPDETKVLVQHLGTPDGNVDLLDVATGQALAYVKDLRDSSGAPVGALLLQGDWRGDTIAAAASAFSGLVFILVSPEDSLSVSRTLDLGRHRLPWGMESPRFSSDGSTVTAFAIIPPKNIVASTGPYFTRVVTCGQMASTCSYVAPLPDRSAQAFPVSNPSR
jgi:hypothetical protein